MTTPEDAIRQAVEAITTPPAPDPAGLLQTVAAIRATHASPLYQSRPDLVAREEAQIAALLAKAGVAEPAPETPAQRAAREIEASFRSLGNEIEPHLQQVIDADLASIEKLSPTDQERRAMDLRHELGPDYDRLQEQAKGAPGWKPSVALSRRALVLLAGVGRYRQAHARARGRLG